MSNLKHHPSDALSCGLTKVVYKCVMCIYYLGPMQRFCTEILIRATALTYDIAAFKARLLFQSFNLEILCNIFTKKCVNNTLKRRKNSVGGFVFFLF